MHTVKLVKWGNSVGIRLSLQEVKAAKAYIGEEFKISVNAKGGFTLTPIKNMQKGWLQAFNKVADEDEILIDHLENDFDQDEWKW